MIAIASGDLPARVPAHAAARRAGSARRPAPLDRRRPRTRLRLDGDQADRELGRTRAAGARRQRAPHAARRARALLELLDSQTCALIGARDRGRAARAASARSRARASTASSTSSSVCASCRRSRSGRSMARYEPIRAGDGHHHHLVCDSCGTVMPFTDDGLEHAIRKLSRRVPDARRRARDRPARRLQILHRQLAHGSRPHLALRGRAPDPLNIWESDVYCGSRIRRQPWPSD